MKDLFRLCDTNRVQKEKKIIQMFLKPIRENLVLEVYVALSYYKSRKP